MAESHPVASIRSRSTTTGLGRNSPFWTVSDSKETVTTNRPTIQGLFKVLTYRPEPKPLIDASEAGVHLREQVRVQGTVTGIETNRRGDVILRFGSPKEAFK